MPPNRTNFRSVGDYIAAQPEATRPILERVRSIILEALPGAEETISYQIPTYRLHGTYVVYLSGAQRHFALYPTTEALTEALGDRLTPHLHGKGTMRFPLTDPVPTSLIRRIVKLRAREVAAAANAKARAKAAARR
jgi:uncharacterized protein YdhG (YjbR/CyaY superfamily)